MPFQPGANLYTQGFGSRPESVEVPHLDSRIPTTTDVNYPVGKWWNYVGNSLWYLLSLSSSASGTSANWVEVISSSGDIISIVGTANEITVITTAGVATISLPSAIVAPGSLTTTTTLAAGTTVTAGTGITATTGNIAASSGNVTASGTVTGGTGVVATTGNLTTSAAAAGLVTVPTTGSGAASGAVTCNGRVGIVTFTSPSIAAGATQTLTVTNSSITGSTTVVLYSLYGSTTGAALNIQSVTNSASSSAVVVENGTGATTQSGSIILAFLVLN